MTVISHKSERFGVLDVDIKPEQSGKRRFFSNCFSIAVVSGRKRRLSIQEPAMTRQPGIELDS